MGIFSRIKRGASAGLVFNSTLDKCGINYRIFPNRFQAELFAVLRSMTGDDPDKDEIQLRIAANTIAAFMSPQFASSTGCFMHPTQGHIFRSMARIIVPLLERHGLPHHFEMPSGYGDEIDN